MRLDEFLNFIENPSDIISAQPALCAKASTFMEKLTTIPGSLWSPGVQNGIPETRHLLDNCTLQPVKSRGTPWYSRSRICAVITLPSQVNEAPRYFRWVLEIDRDSQWRYQCPPTSTLSKSAYISRETDNFTWQPVKSRGTPWYSKARISTCHNSCCQNLLHLPAQALFSEIQIKVSGRKRTSGWLFHLSPKFF